MAVTVEQLLDRLNADETRTTDAQTALTLAQQLVTDYVGEETVPAVVLDEAVMRVAVGQFNQGDAPQGVLMTITDDQGDGGETVLRVSSDPLRPARWVLAPYVAPLGFA